MTDGGAGAPPGEDAPLPWTGIADKASYYRLFVAYILALLATGVATVALALLAFELDGDDSGAVLGTALSLKMLAYIVAAPFVGVLIRHIPRKPLLIALDVLRAGSLLVLPFVTATWHVFALVFVFSLASAVFTLVYQTVVPYLLANQQDYTKSLARSRVAAELESSISPLLAAGLLLVFASTGVFVVAAVAFLLSAWLIGRMRMPRLASRRAERLMSAVLRGPRLFLGIPDLRGLIALDIAVAAASAMVMVNTVVIVQGVLDLDRRASAYAFAVFGLGSILGAIAITPALRALPDRAVMLGGAALLSAGMFAGTMIASLKVLFAVWFLIGLGCALALTPASYLIRRIAPPTDLQYLFAAQLSLTSACLLVAYSAAGWLGATVGLPATFAALGLVAAGTSVIAAVLWPSGGGPTAPAEGASPR
ncbi:MAG: MFS transporter [Rhodobacteraceae bacterium]|jgi:MFS family permease|nr:MFS transporter [Paracoccaceae bacterium]